MNIVDPERAHPHRVWPGAALSLLVVACATGPGGGAPAVPASLGVAGTERLALHLPARGVQIYECKADKADQGPKWSFVAPEADLLDRSGKVAGKHYAGPTWELPDGSRVVGTLKQRADAPDALAIPWLLLSARSTGGPGALEKVTSIQRVNTVGGAAPAGGCDSAGIGQRVRVPYSADYYFYVTG